MKVVYCSGLYSNLIIEAVKRQEPGEHEYIMLVRQGDQRAGQEGVMEVDKTGRPLRPIVLSHEDLCVLDFITDTPQETVWAIAHMSMSGLRCRVVSLDLYWCKESGTVCGTVQMAPA